MSERNKNKFRWKGEDEDVELKKEVNTPAEDKGKLKGLEP
jgi:hypothetical protein